MSTKSQCLSSLLVQNIVWVHWYEQRRHCSASSSIKLASVEVVKNSHKRFKDRVYHHAIQTSDLCKMAKHKLAPYCCLLHLSVQKLSRLACPAVYRMGRHCVLHIPKNYFKFGHHVIIACTLNDETKLQCANFAHIC